MISGGRGFLILLGAPLLAGCSLWASTDPGFDDVRDEVAERVSYRVEWPADSPAEAAIDESVRELLASDLSADSAVQIALLNNRNLLATYEDLGVARADLVQAGLLRNPVIAFERRFAGQALEFDIVQEFIELITMPLRRRVAGNAFATAKLRVAGAVLDLVAEVQEGFYRAQAAGELVGMHRQVLRGTEASAELAQRMRDAGNITELELRIEQRFVREAQLNLAAAEVEAVESRERLNALLGLWGEDTTWRVAPRLPSLPADEVSLAGMESLAVSRRLDLAAARQNIVTAAETLGLSNALRWIPSVAGQVHLEREPDGNTTIGPGLDLVLPIFDWGQAAVPRDRALLRQKQQSYIALAVEIRSQVRVAYSRLRAARDRAEFYRQTVLPLQVEILDHAQREYNAMILGPLQLFQLKQAEIETGRESIEAQRDYWIARAVMEHAVGGRIDNSAPPSTPSNQAAEVADDHQEHHH